MPIYIVVREEPPITSTELPCMILEGAWFEESKAWRQVTDLVNKHPGQSVYVRPVPLNDAQEKKFFL